MVLPQCKSVRRVKLSDVAQESATSERALLA
jgi:hypothetical protein